MKQSLWLFICMFNANQSFATQPPTPRVEFPLVITTSKLNDNRLLFYISGDGGWTKFCQQLSASYAAKGIPVVGLNSLKYFWERKTAVQAASDVALILRKYMSDWHRSRIILCGCSFGADVLPFIYRKLPEDLRSKVTLMQLLSASSSTDFEVHLSEMVSLSNTRHEFSVPEEVKLLTLPVVCTYGKRESDQPLSSIKNTNFQHVFLDGDHRYTEKMIPAIMSTIR